MRRLLTAVAITLLGITSVQLGGAAGATAAEVAMAAGVAKAPKAIGLDKARADPHRPVNLRNLAAYSRCMGVEGGGTQDGSRILLWTCNGKADQAWWVNFDGGAHPVWNGLSGKCLGVSGGSTTQGAGLVIWECDGSANQQWHVEWSSECGGVILVNQILNPSTGRPYLLAGVEGGNTSNGARIIQWPHAGSRDQTWCQVYL